MYSYGEVPYLKMSSEKISYILDIFRFNFSTASDYLSLTHLPRSQIYFGT